MTTPTTWVDGAAGSLFDLDNLPYGVFTRDGEDPGSGSGSVTSSSTWHRSPRPRCSTCTTFSRRARSTR